ncbi:MAG TPA: hypothetical protein VEC60_21070 [Reyranella sp.]|nr:hypothetical protein [Reyranella sp.]
MSKIAKRAKGSRTRLTSENLEALGARRLAELLMELAENNAAATRRLRLELVAKEAPEDVAAEVGKRLGQIARAGSFIHGHNVREFATDLDTQRRAIVDRVAKIDAAQALDLMWRFMDLAETAHERCDDSSGEIGELFRVACDDLGSLAQAAKPEPAALADRVFDALNDNGYGQYDGLIGALAPALGSSGLDHLKANFIELLKTPIERPAEDERRVIGWGLDGKIYQNELMASRRKITIQLALQEIADLQGDVDAFIAQYDEQARKVPGIAATIARRLLAANRAEEALKALDAAEHRHNGWVEFEWEDARIDTLDALGRSNEAQAARWSCFERALSRQHLRAYLKRLPDFDDFEAEERALKHAECRSDVLEGIAFLVSWPALERAARLVNLRAAELNGDRYEVLSPAADALAGKYPLAATLLLRAMIDFTLTKARSSRYRHAARHFMECASLVSSIADFGTFETHEAYAARLQAKHGRKSGFWALIP